MSLHALAGHMATKGRNGDSMLVHMTPGEVAGLQALAVKHGGELTINPDTGLPEANFLKKMLPMIAGLALAPLTAGTSLAFLGATPLASALTVGGITGLATGSLSRGLMAGLGAYGGASLGAGLAGAGAGAAQEAAVAGLTGEQVAQQAAAQGLTEQGVLNQAAAEATKNFAASGAGSQLAQGATAAFNNPSSFVQGMGGTAKTLGAGYAAALPMMADEGVKTTTKRPDTGTIRNFTFDPYGQTYSDAGSYPASEYRGMAQGGIVALAEGGLSADQAQKLIEAQYATIGRTGVGTGANQIDQAGLKGWTDALVRGEFKPEDLSSRFSSAVTDYMAQNPNDQYTQYVSQFKANQANPAATSAAAAPAAYTPFSASNINNYIADNNLDAAGIAAATKQFNVDPNLVIGSQNAQEAVSNVYRNVLGRDPDPVGLAYWSNKITSGQSTGQEMYDEFLKSAQSVLGTAGAKEIFRSGISLEDAVKPFAGYSSADKRNIADEWVRNTLGREVTDSDRAQQWYKDAISASSMSTYDAAQDIFKDFQNYAAKTGQSTDEALANARAILRNKNLTEADVLAQTGKSLSELVRGTNLNLGLFQASQLNAPGSVFDLNSLKAKETGATNPYGNATGNALTQTPGDQTFNKDGSITVQPNIPGRPYGGFAGMQQVKDAYTAGGGSLGYTNAAPKTMEEFNERFNTQTGDSLAAYNYLVGKGANPVKSGVGEIMRPYSEAVRGVPAAEGRPTQKYIYQNGKYVENPNYRPLSYTSKGERKVGMTSTEVIKGLQGLKDPKDDGALFDWVTKNNISEAQLAAALGISLSEARARLAAGKTKSTGSTDVSASSSGGDGGGEANGGLMKLAAGGYAVGGGLGALAAGGQTGYNLGGYSDGGRLLRGPGDGVSDSIPATIGDKQPARLADGEFVVPARIVSELGNGSTEAGARKLYAMMDRVQKARGKTTGKTRVAANTRSEKYLPA